MEKLSLAPLEQTGSSMNALPCNRLCHLASPLSGLSFMTKEGYGLQPAGCMASDRSSVVNQFHRFCSMALVLRPLILQMPSC